MWRNRGKAPLVQPDLVGNKHLSTEEPSCMFTSLPAYSSLFEHKDVLPVKSESTIQITEYSYFTQ